MFGGSIFEAIGQKNKWKKIVRDKKNNLEEEVKKMNVQYLYGGGFYILRNIKYSEEEDGEESNLYMDIWILLTLVDDID